MPSPVPRPLAAGLITTVLVLGAAGCGGSKGVAAPAAAPPAPAWTAPATAGPHDAADITFAQDLLAQHQQTGQVTALAADHSADGRITALATRVTAAQQTGSATLRGLLTAWGVTSAGSRIVNGRLVSGGALDDARVAGLESSGDGTFDRLFVAAMIDQDRAAVALARAELAGGTSTGARALATAVVTGADARLADLRQLQAKL